MASRDGIMTDGAIVHDRNVTMGYYLRNIERVPSVYT